MKKKLIKLFIVLCLPTASIAMQNTYTKLATLIPYGKKYTKNPAEFEKIWINKLNDGDRAHVRQKSIWHKITVEAKKNNRKLGFFTLNPAWKKCFANILPTCTATAISIGSFSWLAYTLYKDTCTFRTLALSNGLFLGGYYVAKNTCANFAKGLQFLHKALFYQSHLANKSIDLDLLHGAIEAVDAKLNNFNTLEWPDKKDSEKEKN